MATITANISIQDGNTTPVPRAFEPRKVGVALTTIAYKPAVGLNLGKAAWIQADVVWSDSTKTRPTVRQSINISFPIIRVNGVSGLEEVVGVARADLSFVVPDLMTENEANDLHAFVRNIANAPQVKVGVTKREPIFGA